MKKLGGGLRRRWLLGGLLAGLAAVATGAYWFVPLPIEIPSPRSIKRIQGSNFLELEIPARANLTAVAEAALNPILQDQAKNVALAPAGFKLSLYHQLSEAARDRVRHYLRLPAVDEEKAFVELSKPFEGARISVLPKSMKISGGKPDAPTKLSPIGKSMIGIHLLYEAERGIILRFPGREAAIYLIQLNKTNLRAFTIDRHGVYDDKTYGEFAVSLFELSNASYCSRLLRTLTEGFSPASLNDLSESQETILYDMVGIYLAEAFRIHARKADGKVFQRIPSGILISLYLHSGGKPLSSKRALRGPKGFGAAHFTVMHREYNLLLKGYDAEITTYLRQNHALLMTQLGWYLPLRQEGLLTAIAKYAEDPRYFNRHLRKLLDVLCRVIEREAPLMSDARNPTILKK